MSGQVIQGNFPYGFPRHLAQPATIQPRVAHPPAVKTHPNPHTTPALIHQQQMAKTAVAPRPVLPGAQATGPTTPVVQRSANGQAFQLPANLSEFGGAVGQPLPAPVREKMESFFGTSFADVRVHVGAQASSIGALAFTHGSKLFFAPGQYNPNTPQGQQLLGHELTHVVQQRAGRVRNPFGSGIAVVQDRNMEAEADRMGLRAAAHQLTVQVNAVHNKPVTNQSTGRPIASAIRPLPSPGRPFVQRMKRKFDYFRQFTGSYAKQGAPDEQRYDEHIDSIMDVLDQSQNQLWKWQDLQNKGKKTYRRKKLTTLSNKEKRNITEAVGELVASDYMRKNYPQAKLIWGFAKGTGIDQIWDDRGTIIVVEAKGPGAQLGVSDAKGKQMSKSWVERTANSMSNSKDDDKQEAGELVLNALAKGKCIGIVVTATATGKTPKNAPKIDY